MPDTPLDEKSKLTKKYLWQDAPLKHMNPNSNTRREKGPKTAVLPLTCWRNSPRRSLQEGALCRSQTSQASHKQQSCDWSQSTLGWGAGWAPPQYPVTPHPTRDVKQADNTISAMVLGTHNRAIVPVLQQPQKMSCGGDNGWHQTWGGGYKPKTGQTWWVGTGWDLKVHTGEVSRVSKPQRTSPCTASSLPCWKGA